MLCYELDPKVEVVSVSRRSTRLPLCKPITIVLSSFCHCDMGCIYIDSN